ncbi:hypothetical protein LXA43DRAFT_1119298 [Ganoderma leucocontextum]|nr:hypothetical protein LXA43DRAFT_1119298 [Ganoderma leucocontextum]
MPPQPRPSRPRPSAPSSASKPASRSKPGGGRQHPLAQLDTNPASYSRTDPFSALNALRSLLSLLPSRLGPCHLKLAPAEHALALHLLAVVEPFVGLAPCSSRRVLARQPTEVLDAIAFHVEAQRDLLALALTCRRLHAVVVPRHAAHRLVRAKASQLAVWHHLAVHRALARNVRRLEVLDERASADEVVVPPGIRATDTDLESTDDELGMHAKQERFLVSALRQMSALTAFRWSCSHSLVAFERVWPVLVRCAPGLREVEVNDNLVFQAVDIEEETAGSGARAGGARKQRQVLNDLTKVGLHGTKSTFGLSKNPDLSRISAMLHNCPNIQALDISYVPRYTPGFFSPVADDFLLCGRWAALRSLTLTNLWCTPHAGLDAAAAFLLSHATLEVLHLDVAFGTGAGTGAGAGALAAFKFPPNCLPRLHELKACRELASALLACPCPCPGGRPLATLKGVRLSGSAARDRAFLENLRAGGDTVRRLELAGWNEMEDVRRLAECVPKLVWLDLGKRGGAGSVGNTNAAGSGAGGNGGKQPANVSTNFVEWASVLAQMPELTTFHGLRFFYEVASTAIPADGAAPLSLSDRSRVRKNDEVASVLAWKCPKLRRLDHWDEGSGRVIVLVRDAERVRYEVRRTLKV